MDKLFNKDKLISIGKFIISVVLMYLVLYFAFNYIPFLSRYNHYVIVTDSMEEVINPNDIVFINTDFKHEDIERNQIFAFYVDVNNDGREEVVVHFIDEVNTSNGVNTYKTRPNISNIQDSWTLQERDIIGEYKARIPSLGKFLLFVTSTIGKIVIVVDILVIYALFSIFKSETKEEENIFTDDLEKYNEKVN